MPWDEAGRLLLRAPPAGDVRLVAVLAVDGGGKKRLLDSYATEQ